MATRKKPAKKTASLEQLYRKALPDEDLPDPNDLRLMVRAGQAIGRLAPWDSLQDEHVFAYDSSTGQRWYVVVMGALGQVFGLQAYRGDAGFALFDDVQRDRLQDSSTFLARQDLYTVEFVRRAELSPLDRAILEQSPEPIPHGTLVPQVTVSRPGMLRWYPNAGDVAEINDGLMASLLFFEWLAKHPKADPWAKEGELPLVKDWLTSLKVKQVPHPPRPSAAVPEPAKLDERQLNQLLLSVPKRELGHPLEVDVFLMLAPIAEGRRPFFPWAGLACDASSGYLFGPVMGGRGERPEDLLLKAALNALEKSPFRPVEYRVRDEGSRAVLERLAQVFDIPVKVGALPATTEARAAIESFMRR